VKTLIIGLNSLFIYVTVKLKA